MTIKAKLVKVVPVTKTGARVLSYFSLKNVQVGDLVSVPLRKKEVPAIVLKTEDIRDAKSELRRLEYQLKRVTKIISSGFFDKPTIKALQEIAHYFLEGPGVIAKKFLPQVVLDKALPLSTSLADKKSSTKNAPEKIYPKTDGERILVLQAPKEERIKFYKNIIRAEFAQKKSVFICLPTVRAIKKYTAELEKGIEKYTFRFFGKQSKKEILKNWQAVTTEEHPVLIIATPSFLLLPRRDISHLVIEKESSSSFGLGLPSYTQVKKSAEILAKQKNFSVILADEIISTETHHRKTAENLGVLAPPLYKKNITAHQQLVDMRQKNRLISVELEKTLRDCKQSNSYSALFINRRGYGLSTVCQDCGDIFVCPHCDTPLVLHQKSSRKFICHKCFAESSASDKCLRCGGSKLITLGRGIQKIEEELQALFPKNQVFRLDSNSAPTEKEGEKIIAKYLSKPGNILLGTEMMFSFLRQPINTVGVVSIDNLFSLPDFRINEKIFRHLLELKSLAQKNFIIQTNLPEHPLFECLSTNNIAKFYEQELSMRQALKYPPFKVFIKIIRSGKNKAQVKRSILSLEKKLRPYHPESFPAFTPKIKNIYTHYILLRLDPHLWPPTEDSDEKTKKLYQILSSLPLPWRVNVDPETLL